MTKPKDLLHPLEPAQRLAKADRDALDALLAAVADCRSLIATERTALQQATQAQQETLQACVDAVGRLSEEIGAAGRDDAARHAELTAAVRQVPAAVAGLPERLDETGAEHPTRKAGDRDGAGHVKVGGVRVLVNREFGVDSHGGNPDNVAVSCRKAT